MNQGVICAEGPYEGKTWDDVKKIVVKGKGEAVWMSWPQSVRWRERTENDDLKEENKRLNEEVNRLNEENKRLNEFFRPRNVREFKELFDKIDFETVDYLEDNDTGEIYNTNYNHVGCWNADCDDIIWINDEFREKHEALRS